VEDSWGRMRRKRRREEGRLRQPPASSMVGRLLNQWDTNRKLGSCGMEEI
jgi:hypothetical protein